VKNSATAHYQLVDITDIDPGKFHGPDRPKIDPRLLERAKRFGIVIPAVLAPIKRNGYRYELLESAESWFLAQTIGAHHVPAVVREDLDADEFNEMWQQGRAGLDPITWAKMVEREVANGVFGRRPTRTVVAARLGMRLSALSSRMRLLSLHPDVQKWVRTGELGEFHARALTPLSPADQVRRARQIIAGKLTVRQAENLARGLETAMPGQSTDSDIRRMEEQLSDYLGCRTRIADGKLIVDYNGNLEVLEGVLDHMRFKLH